MSGRNIKRLEWERKLRNNGSLHHREEQWGPSTDSSPAENPSHPETDRRAADRIAKFASLQKTIDTLRDLVKRASAIQAGDIAKEASQLLEEAIQAKTNLLRKQMDDLRPVKQPKLNPRRI